MEPAALLAFLASIWRRWRWLPSGIELPWVLSRQVARVTPWLSGWPAPVMVGLIAMGLIVRVWGSTDEPGVVHDERAIVLQARIFAGGQWRGPTPPEPAAFEQMHVFAEPGVASKYPPFHSAVLVPGVWLSRPGLMPVVLSGVAAGLFFALARNALGGWVALASTCLLMTSQPNLFWRSTYFSETTTSALWLGVVWCVLEWQSRARWWLLALASLCFALMGLTRPLAAYCSCFRWPH